jgi:hypothetical protein
MSEFNSLFAAARQGDAAAPGRIFELLYTTT